MPLTRSVKEPACVIPSPGSSRRALFMWSASHLRRACCGRGLGAGHVAGFSACPDRCPDSSPAAPRAPPAVLAPRVPAQASPGAPVPVSRGRLPWPGPSRCPGRPVVKVTVNVSVRASRPAGPCSQDAAGACMVFLLPTDSPPRDHLPGLTGRVRDRAGRLRAVSVPHSMPRLVLRGPREVLARLPRRPATRESLRPHVLDRHGPAGRPHQPRVRWSGWLGAGARGGALWAQEWHQTGSSGPNSSFLRPRALVALTSARTLLLQVPSWPWTV